MSDKHSNRAVDVTLAWLLALNLSAVSFTALSQNNQPERTFLSGKLAPEQLSIEELRLTKAQQAMPALFTRHNNRIQAFANQLKQVRNFTALTQLILRHGRAIWQEAVSEFANRSDLDDRALYWARLQMSTSLKQAPAFRELLSMQQAELLWKFELLTRGKDDVKFDKGADKKILLTGFDPFSLDKNIKQSNPSGIAALALDDFFASVDGQSVEIETLMIPVRFKDFDQGMIETLLTPYFSDKKVDMIITVSMGRADFDLDRFAGLRRSAKVADNVNVYTGANAENPLPPLLNNSPIEGAEFVEFSLPAQVMQTVQTPFKVNDNRTVTLLSKNTLNKTFAAPSLSALQEQTAVEGSGGGYLSNEISYRSILLRNKYQPLMPVGHIHTPRIIGVDQRKSAQIIKQLKTMLAKASATLR